MPVWWNKEILWMHLFSFFQREDKHSMLVLQFIYILKVDYILCLNFYPQHPPGNEEGLGTTPILKFWSSSVSFSKAVF